MNQAANPSIESSLPKSWEQAASLQDNLYSWTKRAPWFSLSLALHLLIYFVFAAIPWSELKEEPVLEIQAGLETPPEEIFELPEELVIEEVLPELDHEPELIEEEFAKEMDDSLNESELLAPQDLYQDAAFFDCPAIGLGPGSALGNRRSVSGRGKGKDRSGTQQPLSDALEWLKHHQNPDGSWSAEGFDERCGSLGAGRCSGQGNPAHDVGVTGLALLAFMGNGCTTSSGQYGDVVSRGIAFLKGEQKYAGAGDPGGLIGDDSTQDFIYNHAIASLALCEAYYFSKSPLLRNTAQAAIDYIARARNPYGAWRYGAPSQGDNDTSVTGWMLFALKAAEDADLRVNRDAFTDGLAWLDEVTTPKSGHVGYDARGHASSRTPSNEIYPRNKGEAMTAVGLLCRIFLGQDPKTTQLGGEAIMQNGADLLLTKLPEWDAEGFGCDMYYWYYGTYAMYQMGGKHWKRWNLAMKETALKNQTQVGDAKGSWDPVGPWGHAGGRVYSTALMALCLEVYFRYDKVLGAR